MCDRFREEGTLILRLNRDIIFSSSGFELHFIYSADVVAFKYSKRVSFSSSRRLFSCLIGAHPPFTTEVKSQDLAVFSKRSSHHCSCGSFNSTLNAFSNCRLIEKSMFPKSQNNPSLITQLMRDFAVARFITVLLVNPVFNVLFGRFCAARAKMPKTAVHKDSYLQSWESEIRFSRQRQMPPPPHNTVPSKYFRKQQLRGLITSAADRGHIF